MIKKHDDIAGTSWYGYELYTSKDKIIKALGIQPKESNDGKTQYDWWCIYDSTIVFTIYDWKELYKIKDDDLICWHIGTYTAEDGEFIKNILIDLIK